MGRRPLLPLPRLQHAGHPQDIRRHSQQRQPNGNSRGAAGAKSVFPTSRTRRPRPCRVRWPRRAREHAGVTQRIKFLFAHDAVRARPRGGVPGLLTVRPLGIQSGVHVLVLAEEEVPRHWSTLNTTNGHPAAYRPVTGTLQIRNRGCAVRGQISARETNTPVPCRPHPGPYSGLGAFVPRRKYSQMAATVRGPSPSRMSGSGLRPVSSKYTGILDSASMLVGARSQRR